MVSITIANQTAVDLGYEVKKEVGVSAQQVQAIMPEVVAHQTD
jgi:hypothetical protein